MKTLQEGDLQMTLPDDATGRKFDGPNHRLSHCMKAVDWIVELPDRIYFIEVKDLDSDNAKGHKERCQYLKELKEKKHDSDFVGKFRDSFLYEWACNRAERPISYLVVIACKDLDPALLQYRKQALQRKLPTGLKAGWLRPLAKDCLVFNVETWNAHFPEFPLSRIKLKREA